MLSTIMCFSQEFTVVKGAEILPLLCVENQIPAPTSHGVFNENIVDHCHALKTKHRHRTNMYTG